MIEYLDKDRKIFKIIVLTLFNNLSNNLNITYYTQILGNFEKEKLKKFT
jgi:hypothetical protein